jgi:hypothetical protein
MAHYQVIEIATYETQGIFELRVAKFVERFFNQILKFGRGKYDWKRSWQKNGSDHRSGPEPVEKENNTHTVRYIVMTTIHPHNEISASLRGRNPKDARIPQMRHCHTRLVPGGHTLCSGGPHSAFLGAP